MARARLHVICGNCGCNDEFEWLFHKDAADNGDSTFEDDVEIRCNNCGTIHWISDNAKAHKDD